MLSKHMTSQHAVSKERDVIIHDHVPIAIVIQSPKSSTRCRGEYGSFQDLNARHRSNKHCWINRI